MWIYNASAHRMVPANWSLPQLLIEKKKLFQQHGPSSVNVLRLPSLPVAAHKAFQMGTSIFTGGRNS